jgi:hypothetical protein
MAVLPGTAIPITDPIKSDGGFAPYRTALEFVTFSAAQGWGEAWFGRADLSYTRVSGKRSHAHGAFAVGLDWFYLGRFWFLAVEGGSGHVEIERLLELGHEGAQVFVACVQDSSQLRTGCHRLLIGIAGLGQEIHVLHERRGGFPEVFHCAYVCRHDSIAFF